MAEIRTIAVIGAGTAGRGMAQRAALGGFSTILEDILPASLRRAEGEIRATLERAAESGALDRSSAEAALARIEYATSIEQAARAADLVIEAVPEELESKLEIFILLDKVARPTTILASTTSAFSIAELASVTYRAQRIVGLRVTPSAGEGEWLEVIRARETDEGTMVACAEAAHRLGKNVVLREETLLKR